MYIVKHPKMRDKAFFDELLLSKEIIEEKLKGRKVTHLCYPWYDANQHAVEASRKAGFEVNYFGQQKDRVSNKPGDDPLNIVRVDERCFFSACQGQIENRLDKRFFKCLNYDHCHRKCFQKVALW